MSTEIPRPAPRVSRRYVADRTTASMIARAYLGFAHRSTRLWVVYVLVLVILAGVLLLGMDESFGLGYRAAWAVVYALPFVAVFAVLTSAMSYVRTVRGARHRVFPGAVLEAHFGDDAMRLANPLGESLISYAGVRRLVVGRRAAFLQLHGSPTVAVYPRDLFPDEAVALVRTHTAPDRTRSA